MMVTPTPLARGSLAALSVLLGLLAAGTQAGAASRFPAAYRWRTVETPHFSIHFHQGLEPHAQRLAHDAESIHATLAPRLRWSPRGKTQVVLTDNADFSNGFATPFPNNMIQIWARPPQPGEGLDDYNDWLRFVLAHEYTHILHIDQVHRGPKALRLIFGRVPTLFFFPNAFSPGWLVEGLAVFEETSLTGGGRAGGTAFEMMMRAAVLEDRFDSLARAEGMQTRWPNGMGRYLYGASFLTWAARSFGEEKLYDLTHEYAGRLLPFRISSAFEKTVGTDLPTLWSNWHEALQTRYAAVRTAVEKGGETGSRPLTERGYFNTGPRFHPTEGWIAFTELGPHEFPSIRRIAANGEDEARLIKHYSESSLSFSPDGAALAYSQLQYYWTFSIFSDLYLYDVAADKARRLTYGARLRDPDFHPDGKRLIAVREGGSGTDLVLVDVSTAEVTALTHEEPGVVFGTPRWSPDGSRVAVDARRGKNQDIEIFDNRGALVETLLPGDASEAGPIFAPGGGSLFFTSNPQGISNVYNLDLETRALRRVTNEVTGAFSPAPSADGKELAFVRYGAEGYDVHVLELAAARGGDAAALEVPAARVGIGSGTLPAATTAQEYPVHSYRSARTLLPRFWLPAGGSDEDGTQLGATTQGVDALGEQAYAATALYGIDSGRLAWFAAYQNDMLYPTVTAEAADLAANLGDLWSSPEGEPGHIEDIADYWERRRTARLTISVPVSHIESGHAAVLGAVGQRLTGLSAYPRGLAAPAEGDLVGFTLGYAYDRTRAYGYSISKESGCELFAGYTRFDRKWKSDFDRDEGVADLRWYAPVFFARHHAVAGWVKAAASRGDAFFQRRFAIGGTLSQEGLLGMVEGGFPLRGYPEAVLRGDRAVVASFEYRFPIAVHEAGPDRFPLFLDRTHLGVFADAGVAWDGDFGDEDESKVKSSAGIEGKVNLVLGYGIPMSLRLGVARRLDSDVPEEDRFVAYFGFGHEF
ncbi:MAG: hypothetical protein HYV63_25180 [Candidatus Schekmanbacteria bacterium]|nr:hypothetical protein [Candidatus Schekmanbacteria bacterium]